MAQKEEMKRYFQDKYDDVWVLTTDNTFKRLKDGNLGGFWNGRELIEIPAPKGDSK